MCKENNKNTKPDSNNQGKGSSKSHSIGENLTAQEQIRKAHELRPKVDPKPKK